MSYSRLSHFYDLENADFIEDLDFWVQLARDSGGPVLELGCGSGRVTQQIARAGINIVGLDNSEEMLELARNKISRKPDLISRTSLINGDMTKFEIQNPKSPNADTQPPDHPTTFALIIVPFNTFMHLTTQADQLALLTCARKHLVTGGQLVLDLTNPAPAYADPPTESLTLERTFRDELNNLTIEQFSTIRLDRVDQIAQIVYHYDTIDEKAVVHRTLIPITLRYTFPTEVSLLLGQTGFKLAHLYGDYGENPLTDDSDRMIVVAEAV
jgi:SAM-dependent methyltransferase